MNTFANTSAVITQYATASNLNTRISIHEKYSVNKQGFGHWITEHYPIRPGMRVLELGCGTGSMWLGHEDLIAHCSELILSDFSGGMLETAKRNVTASNVRHEVIDIQDIPYQDNSFDLVIANMMLYHVPDLPKALSEVRRVLKHGGTFFCATYGECGIMAYLTELLSEFGIRDNTGRTFTLQNGAGILASAFTDIRRLDYSDALAVTDPCDLVDYLYSLPSMTGLSPALRKDITNKLISHMDQGVLTVPKEYGLFLCK